MGYGDMNMSSSRVSISTSGKLRYTNVIESALEGKLMLRTHHIHIGIFCLSLMAASPERGKRKKSFSICVFDQ